MKFGNIPEAYIYYNYGHSVFLSRFALCLKKSNNLNTDQPLVVHMHHTCMSTGCKYASTVLTITVE